MADTCIYVVTHKNIANKIAQDGYEYIGVGTNEDLNVECRDNTGDNISSKNANYCELTVQYWISHNSNSKYVGLVHYRRFFYKNIWAYFSNKILDVDYIERKLQKCDVILPKRWFIVETIYRAYKHGHHIKDLDACGNIIKAKCPEYYPSFEKLKKLRSITPCNMIITSKEIYDEYSKWLFDILFEVEKITDITAYSAYNKRVYGFLSERLLNVYFDYHREYKVLRKPVYQINESKNTFFSRIHYRLSRCRGVLRLIIVTILKKMGFKRRKPALTPEEEARK